MTHHFVDHPEQENVLRASRHLVQDRLLTGRVTQVHLRSCVDHVVVLPVGEAIAVTEISEAAGIWCRRKTRTKRQHLHKDFEDDEGVGGTVYAVAFCYFEFGEKGGKLYRVELHPGK